MICSCTLLYFLPKVPVPDAPLIFSSIKASVNSLGWANFSATCEYVWRALRRAFITSPIITTRTSRIAQRPFGSADSFSHSGYIAKWSGIWNFSGYSCFKINADVRNWKEIYSVQYRSETEGEYPLIAPLLNEFFRHSLSSLALASRAFGIWRLIEIMDFESRVINLPPSLIISTSHAYGERTSSLPSEQNQ